MTFIPDVINGVVVHTASTVNENVDHRVIDALYVCIGSQITGGTGLHSIYISSAFDSHVPPSRHSVAKAVDISRINGFLIGAFYEASGEVKAIVDAIQEAFETYPHRRENFGPHFKRKLGLSWSVGGHLDHIHLSVN